MIAKEWAPSGSIDRYLNSHSRIAHHTKTNGSIRDHVLRRWNQADAPGSPSTFYGVSLRTGREGEQKRQENKMYKWDQRVIDALRDA